MSLEKHLAEGRRTCILRLASKVPDYTVNDSLMHTAVRDFGHRVSRDQIRADLAWLAEIGLMRVEEHHGVHIGVLTERGLDAAHGTAIVPGIKRPSPKD